MTRVVVIGGGVIGLMAAHALVHDRHDVTILARELGDATTSARAGASFKPSHTAQSGAYADLLQTSHAILSSWGASGFAADMGISRITHMEASMRPLEDREYLSLMEGVELLRADRGDEIPGDLRHAVRYVTWFFDVPVTIQRFQDHLRAHGVRFEQADLTSPLDQRVLEASPDVVVNASGLGARELVGDRGVTPLRGQTVTIDRSVSDVDYSVSADGMYFYPRSGDILLGGTNEHGRTSTEPDDGAVALIVAGNARIVPELLGATPIGRHATLRPYRRSGVRLETTHDAQLPVVHAYGHGGSGWTLGPGTGQAVSGMVSRLTT